MRGVKQTCMSLFRGTTFSNIPVINPCIYRYQPLNNPMASADTWPDTGVDNQPFTSSLDSPITQRLCDISFQKYTENIR